VTGAPIAFWSQTISGVSAVNPLVTFYDIHERKREVSSMGKKERDSVPDTTRDDHYNNKFVGFKKFNELTTYLLNNNIYLTNKIKSDKTFQYLIIFLSILKRFKS
jgi:hypothetical protein